MNLDQQEADIDDEGLITYESLYSNLIINEEIVVTVAAEDVAGLKVGMKNVKSRQATNNRLAGMPPVAGVLSFIETPSNTAGAIDLTITLSKKGTVKIMGMRIPDGNF